MAGGNMSKEVIADLLIERDVHPIVIDSEGEVKKTEIDLHPGDHIKIYAKDGKAIIRPSFTKVLSTWLHLRDDPMSLTVNDGLQFQEGDLIIS